MMVSEYFDRIRESAIEAAMQSMTRGAERISVGAKRLAPVRKVFEEQDEVYRTRLKSFAEIHRDAPDRERLGLSPENAYIYPPTTVARRAPQMLGARKVDTIDPEALTRRGRYELKTGRSITSRGNLGGRLRDEIHPVPATMEGRIIVSRVVSPTPYAKYQEFGTRHNPAHPYLRPAARQELDDIRKDVSRNVTAAGRKAASSGVRLKPVKVRLKGGG